MKNEPIRKKGGQRGNKNAVGNQGGAPKNNKNAIGYGAPSGNQNATTHGLYSNTGLYGKGPVNYELLSREDQALYDEIMRDVLGYRDSADNVFRAWKFNQDIPIGIEDPIGAIEYSYRLIYIEGLKLEYRKNKQHD